MSLQLSGNSSNPAPWHTKLGFMKQPPIATLDSLTPDGGLVTLMDLTVIKVGDGMPSCVGHVLIAT